LRPSEAEFPRVPGLALPLALLARGGFADVYLASLPSGAEAVLKVAHALYDPRFGHEAEALRRVGAPWVPKLLGEGVTSTGHPYVILERIAGRPLSEILAERVSLPLDEARPLFAALCRAVERVHAAGLVHRDLKPANVMVTPDGRVVLLDLGIAADAVSGRQGVTAEADRLGTPEYMAPEQCRGEPARGPATDLYSLGVLLFQVLCGRPPFVGEAATVLAAHAFHRPPRASDWVALPAAVDDVLLRCLAKEPSLRYSRAGEVASALELAARRTVVSPLAPAPLPRSRAASRRQRVVLLGLDVKGPVPPVLSELAQEGGTVAVLNRCQCVAAFVRDTEAQGLRAALRAAARVEASCATRVIHVAELRLLPSDKGLHLFGDALKHREAYWPRTDEAAVLMTPQAALLLEDRVQPAGQPGFFRLAGSDATLRGGTDRLNAPGREALLGELVDEARLVATARKPALGVLVGEVGLGKTYVLEVLAGRLERDLGFRVVSLCHGGSGPDGGRSGASALAQAMGVDEALGPQGVTFALRQLASAEPVAVLGDDAHWLDDATLEVLAPLLGDEGSCAVYVCLAMRPPLSSLPGAGRGLTPAAIRSLEPLADDAARELLLYALGAIGPLEYVPESVVGALLELGQGVPLFLCELVRALSATGALKPLADGTGVSLAAEDLVFLTETPLGERLARRILAQLSPGLHAFTTLCAVLGSELDPDEIEALERRLDVRGLSELTEVDAGTGLARLADHGLLRPTGQGRYTFRHRLVREALEALCPPPRRRVLHQEVYQLVRASGVGALRVARHAAGAGLGAEAARLYLQVGDEARGRHAALEGEMAYTAALSLGGDDPELAGRALEGRGRMRYRLGRQRESLADLERARRHVDAAEDPLRSAELLLAEAMVLDWCQDWPEAEARVARAGALLSDATPPRLWVHVHLARGRAALRREDVAGATALLRTAASLAEQAKDTDARIMALLLLAPALVYAGQAEEAEALFAQVIDLCEREDDRLHLAVAFCNRQLLWMHRHEPAHAKEDLERAVVLARETGHADMERGPSHNLAELLYFEGRTREALPLARRAYELQLRFHAQAAPEDALLLARILAARGEHEDAKAMAAWLRARCDETTLAPYLRVLLEMVELIVSDSAEEAWSALIVRARHHAVGDERLEVLCAAADWARQHHARELSQRILTEARELAASSPVWLARIHDLALV
jgi:tetratricopeptide (TPR) repeat protein